MALLSLETPSAANWLAALPVSGLSLLYKHSPRCGVSFDAVDEVHAFAAAHPELPVWQLDVVRQRPLSQELSRELGISHASPQVILLRGAHPVWHTSHQRITRTALAEQVATARRG